MHYLKTTKSFSDIRICATRNEDSRHMLDMGVDVGRTDLTLERSWKGLLYILYLELKTLDGELTPSQVKWNERFDASPCKNAQRAVAYGYNDAVRIATEWERGFTALA